MRHRHVFHNIINRQIYIKYNLRSCHKIENCCATLQNLLHLLHEKIQVHADDPSFGTLKRHITKMLTAQESM